MGEHWFWTLVMVTCLVWYSVVTIYVAIKGAADIRSMLARLDELREPPDGNPPGAEALPRGPSPSDRWPRDGPRN